jgi:hypothetical protein
MKKFFLWILALMIMVSAIIYQRTTGPTYPFRGDFQVGEKVHKYKLLRSHETTQGAPITLPDTGESNFSATLNFKRYKTADEITTIAFEKSTQEDGTLEWIAPLPVQPAAGKMEYFVEIESGNSKVRIPDPGEENIVLRYKDPVPDWILWPHIFLMFFSVLIGMRTGLAALFNADDMRKLAFITMGGMTLGGMILGPIVQKYAFGEYWTGFPFGGDLTDNKMLIMWVSWLIAVAVIGTGPKKKEGICRVVVLMAALVMSAVYAIPHSMRGSELDYSQVDQGVDPAEAIGTGD